MPNFNKFFYTHSAEATECTYENQYNCGEYGYNYRVLGTKEIAGIVGGCFGLVALIVAVIVILCCCRQRGITRKWTEEKLGHVNTAASLHTLNGHVPKHGTSTANSTKAWTTAESSRTGFASIRRSPSLPRAKIARRNGDGDSMFDSKSLFLYRRCKVGCSTSRRIVQTNVDNSCILLCPVEKQFHFEFYAIENLVILRRRGGKNDFSMLSIGK